MTHNNHILNRMMDYWTPRYVGNRLRLFYYEKRFPKDPWFPRQAIVLLNAWLSATDVGFEWGSGRSTLWFAQRVSHLTSIEDHQGWYSTVQKMLVESDIKNVNYQFHMINEQTAEYSPYVKAIDSMPDQSLDFVLVDGKYRDRCSVVSIGKLKAGGVLIIDDIHRYLPSISSVPHARPLNMGPANETWAKFAEQVSNWRCVWMTDGVTDTAFWVKPY